MANQEQQAPEITLQDIQVAVEVIDIASARGALRGEELATVGNLRTRLSSFLQYQQRLAQAAQNSQQNAPVKDQKEDASDDE